VSALDRRDPPLIAGFDPELVAEAWQRMRTNPALGRITLMKTYGLTEARAKRLARALKIAAGVDPSWRAARHVEASGGTSDGDEHVPRVETHVPVSNAQRATGTPDMSVESEPGKRTAEGLVSCRFSEADSLDELHRLSETDLEVWEPYKHRISRWGSAGNPCWQVRCEYRLRVPEVRELVAEAALESIREEAAAVPVLPYEHDTENDLAAEISVMDPHLGGLFLQPGVDAGWNLEHCRALWFYGFQEALRRIRIFGEPAELLIPVGNDFLHAEGMTAPATTAGTPQPEMISWQYAAKYGARLLIDTLLWLRSELPNTKLSVKVIQGNHSRATDFMLGLVLSARFWHDPAVEVDDSAEGYKAWRWGSTLIMLEHGHSVPVIRMASLAAQTWPVDWVMTDGGYREWHLGDQHRKGASKPLVYEEQGVAVEGLPGLTPGNEWHKLKSFNNQQRACATAFVYHRHAGPLAKLPVMINSKTNLPMGDDSLKKTRPEDVAPDLV